MEFRQLDRIVDLQLGKSITATRRLHGDEPILEDHFPLFPVLPGVLMLEACYQAGVWLVLATEEFRPAMVMLKSAKSVKYSDFVTPGQTLTVTLEVVKHAETTTSFKAKGTVAGPGKEPTQAIVARLVLERFCLADRYPDRAATDGVLRHEQRKLFQQLMAEDAAIT